MTFWSYRVEEGARMSQYSPFRIPDSLDAIKTADVPTLERYIVDAVVEEAEAQDLWVRARNIESERQYINIAMIRQNLAKLVRLTATARLRALRKETVDVPLRSSVSEPS